MERHWTGTRTHNSYHHRADNIYFATHFGSRIWSSVSNGSQNCPKSRTLTMQDLWNYLKAMHRGVSHTGRPSLRMRGSWCGQSKPTIRVSRTMTSHLRWEKTLNTLPPNWNGHTSGPIAWGKGGECYVWRFLVLRYIIIRAYCPTIDTRKTATGRR